MTCCRIGGNWQKTLIITLYGHVYIHVLNSFGSICMIFFLLAWHEFPFLRDFPKSLFTTLYLTVTRILYTEDTETSLIIFFHEGGEVNSSENYVDRELEDSVRKDEVLWGKSDLPLYDDCVDCRNTLMLCFCVKQLYQFTKEQQWVPSIFYIIMYITV